MITYVIKSGPFYLTTTGTFSRNVYEAKFYANKDTAEGAMRELQKMILGILSVVEVRVAETL